MTAQFPKWQTESFRLAASGTGNTTQRHRRRFSQDHRHPARAADAAKILRDGQTRLIDVGKVTFTKDDGELESRYFLGVASFGMSADVIARVKAGGPDWLPTKGPKWLTGRRLIRRRHAANAAKKSATRVVVQLDDDPARHMTVANLCVANARYFGGGMKIAPNAKLADGKFDVISIGDLGAARILANAPRLYLRRASQHDRCRTCTGNSSGCLLAERGSVGGNRG